MAGIKQKTKSSAKKRFRVTGSGRIKRAKTSHSHNLEHKSAKRRGRLRKMVMVHSTDQERVERMLVL